MDKEDFVTHEIELCMKDLVYYVESMMGHKLNGSQKMIDKLLWENCLNKNRID